MPAKKKPLELSLEVSLSLALALALFRLLLPGVLLLPYDKVALLSSQLAASPLRKR